MKYFSLRLSWFLFFKNSVDLQGGHIRRCRSYYNTACTLDIQDNCVQSRKGSSRSKLARRRLDTLCGRDEK